MKFSSTRYRTDADINAIRGALRNTLAKADVWDAEITSLEEQPEIGVMIDKPVSMLTGPGLVKLLVHDRGSHRDVELVALATTVADGVVAGFAKDTRGLRSMASSRKLAGRVAEALRSAGSLQQVG